MCRGGGGGGVPLRYGLGLYCSRRNDGVCENILSLTLSYLCRIFLSSGGLVRLDSASPCRPYFRLLHLWRWRCCFLAAVVPIMRGLGPQRNEELMEMALCVVLHSRGALILCWRSTQQNHGHLSTTGDRVFRHTHCWRSMASCATNDGYRVNI